MTVTNTQQITRAKELRALGLSLVATASAAGLTLAQTLDACAGIHPPIELPDLPGMRPPADIAPGQMRAERYSADVLAQARAMRQEAHTYASIAQALGVGVRAVIKHAGGALPRVGDKRAKVTPTMHAEIHRLRFGQSMSCAKIARKLELSELTVSRYVKIPPQ